MQHKLRTEVRFGDARSATEGRLLEWRRGGMALRGGDPATVGGPIQLWYPVLDPYYSALVVLFVVGLLLSLPALQSLTVGERLLVAVALLGCLLGLGVWPWALQNHTGNFEQNSAVFLGQEALVAPLRSTSPAAMRLLARALSFVPGSTPHWLVGASTVISGLGVAAAALIASRTAGLAGGWAVVGLLVLDCQRLAWGCSSYHVVHPAAAVMVSAALLTVATSLAAWRRVAATIAAACVYALGVSIRAEMLAYGPCVAVLLLGARGPARRSVAAGFLGMSCLLLPAVLRPMVLGGVLSASSWHPSLALRSVLSGAAATGLLHPWTTGLGGLAALSLMGLTLGQWLRSRRVDRYLVSSGLLGLGLLAAWLGATTFLDASERQVFPQRGFLAVLVVQMAGQLRGRGPQLAGGALLTALLAAQGAAAVDLGQRAGGSQGPGSASRLDPGAAWWRARLDEGCVVIGQEPEGPFARPGHLVDQIEMLDPLRAQVLWQRSGGCLLWRRLPSHERWSEDGIYGWNIRLRALWRWKPIVVDGLVVAVWRQFGGVPGGVAPSPRPLAARLLWDGVPGLFGRGGPPEAVYRLTYSVCPWVESCGLDGAGPTQWCAMSLESGPGAAQRLARAPGEPVLTSCRELERPVCDDEDQRRLAARCWDLLRAPDPTGQP